MWGREMRAGVVFVIAALSIGQGLREWRRSHEESFQSLVRELEARDSHDRAIASAASNGAGPDSTPGGPAPRADRASGRRPGPGGVPVGRIDPNRAGVLELTRLPGIGPALAARIVSDRVQRGVFGSPEALLRVHGIGPKILGRIRAYLSFLPTGGDSLTGF